MTEVWVQTLGANIDDGTLVTFGIALLVAFIGAIGWTLRELFRLSGVIGALGSRMTDHREEDNRRFRDHDPDIGELRRALGFRWASQRDSRPPSSSPPNFPGGGA